MLSHWSLWTESEQAGKWDGGRREFISRHKTLRVCEGTFRETSQWRITKTVSVKFIFSGNLGVDVTPIVRKNPTFRRPFPGLEAGQGLRLFMVCAQVSISAMVLLRCFKNNIAVQAHPAQSY